MSVKDKQKSHQKEKDQPMFYWGANLIENILFFDGWKRAKALIESMDVSFSLATQSIEVLNEFKSQSSRNYWTPKFLEELEGLLLHLQEFEKECQLGLATTRWLVQETRDTLTHLNKELGIDLNVKIENAPLSSPDILYERFAKYELRWLSESGYTEVHDCFEKSLRLLIEAKGDTSKLLSAIKNLNEALEKFAQIACKNKHSLEDNHYKLIEFLDIEKTLEERCEETSATLNRYMPDLSNSSKSDSYLKTPDFEELRERRRREMAREALKHCILCFDDYCHSKKDKRPKVNYYRAARLVYVTGLVIRLIFEKLKTKNQSK